MKQITTGKDLADYLDLNKDEEIKLIKSKMKVKPLKPFSMVFESNFSNLISEKKVTLTDIAVLFKVMEYVSYGNVINLTQQTIANDLNLTQPQVNRSFKKLEEAEVFFKHNGSLFMNPNYITKGDLNKSKDNEAYKAYKSKKYNDFKSIVDNEEELHEAVKNSLSY